MSIEALVQSFRDGLEDQSQSTVVAFAVCAGWAEILETVECSSNATPERKSIVRMNLDGIHHLATTHLMGLMVKEGMDSAAFWRAGEVARRTKAKPTSDRDLELSRQGEAILHDLGVRLGLQPQPSLLVQEPASKPDAGMAILLKFQNEGNTPSVTELAKLLGVGRQALYDNDEWAGFRRAAHKLFGLFGKKFEER